MGTDEHQALTASAQGELLHAPAHPRKRKPRTSNKAPAFKEPPVEHEQHQLYPSNLFDLLPEGHDCFLFHDLFKVFDTGDAERQYSPFGQRAYAPRQILSILIYAYSRGVFSSRQIEQRCREDLGFMFIAGSNCPNFRVLSDFRKDHPALFRSCFKQTLKLAMELKLASLGHVSLDGSKFKAMSYGRLKAREAKLCEEIEARWPKPSEPMNKKTPSTLRATATRWPTT